MLVLVPIIFLAHVWWESAGMGTTEKASVCVHTLAFVSTDDCSNPPPPPVNIVQLHSARKHLLSVFCVSITWDIRMNKTWSQPSKVPRVEETYITMISGLCRRSWESGSRMLLLPSGGLKMNLPGIIWLQRTETFREAQMGLLEGCWVWLCKVCSGQGLLAEGACGTEIQQC